MLTEVYTEAVVVCRDAGDAGNLAWALEGLAATAGAAGLRQGGSGARRSWSRAIGACVSRGVICALAELALDEPGWCGTSAVARAT